MSVCLSVCPCVSVYNALTFESFIYTVYTLYSLFLVINQVTITKALVVRPLLEDRERITE